MSTAPTLNMFTCKRCGCLFETEQYRDGHVCPPPGMPPPPLVPEGPRRDMLVRISVSADFEKRLDNQWEVEREIHADRWSWEWADEANPTTPPSKSR